MDRRVVKTHQAGQEKGGGEGVHQCDDGNGVQQWKHPIPVAINYTSPAHENVSVSALNLLTTR